MVVVVEVVEVVSGNLILDNPVDSSKDLMYNIKCYDSGDDVEEHDDIIMMNNDYGINNQH